MRLLKVIAVAGVLGVTAFSGAHAEYPDHPITLIVPWGAGGGTDATGRILATLLEDELGQPINVLNRTGGGSVIGHTEIASAEPDGYTLGVITTELSMFHWAGVSDLSYQDYQPLGLFNADPSAVLVKASSPYETMEDLSAAIQEEASSIRAGGANQGGVNHLAYVTLVNELGGDRAFWVPTEGAAPALQLLTAGAIDVAVVQLPEAEGLINAGELRPLSVLGTERDPQYPDLPTIAESSGVDFPISGWRGLATPKGVPADITDTLISAMKRVVRGDEFKDLMSKRSFGVVWLGGTLFESYLETRDEAFGDAMSRAGLVK